MNGNSPSCDRCGGPATTDRIPLDSPLGRTVVTLQIAGRAKANYFLLCVFCGDIVERVCKGDSPR